MQEKEDEEEDAAEYSLILAGGINVGRSLNVNLKSRSRMNLKVMTYRECRKRKMRTVGGRSRRCLAGPETKTEKPETKAQKSKKR
jgi:hypothetical protein